MTSGTITEDLVAPGSVGDAPAIATGAAEAPPAYVIVARPSRRHLWVLLGICLLGGLLRFSFMDRPQLWGDDAYTVYRTHADYQSMLDILQYDGFTPLHYELYWLLGKVHTLTPHAVRFLPALFGTLMVPGMYFLAAQLVRRRTALVVALFTACSAYLLGYSRDGKMYMMQWCFSAWSAATLLWWFRSRSRVAYLAWVASSLFMASSHMTGMALLPLEALFFLTRRKVEWRESILFVIGLAIAVIPPAGYITQFNRWAQEEVEDIGFEVEGLNWVIQYNAGRTGPELALNSVTAYLFSWETPNPSMPGRTPAWVVATFTSLMALFLGLAAVGAMPWRRSSIVHGSLSMVERAPEPWWRVALWLGAWMVVPTYFLYCRSMVDFASPGDWWDAAAAYLAGAGWRGTDGRVTGGFWWFLIPASVVAGTVAVFVPRFRQAVVWGVPLLAGAALLVAVVRGAVPQGTLKEREWILWVARPFQVWVDWMTDPVVLLALAILLPGVIVYYCAPEWRGRVRRAAQFALVLAALVGCCWLVYTLVQNKFEKEVAQVLTRTRRGASGTATSVEVATAKAYVERTLWQSIYMPRYMGFVWIAFGIALCALLMRLPTRGLRYVAIGLLLAVNLAQFSARLFAGTEPPLQQVAEEIWRHDSHNPAADPTARVYVNDSLVAPPGHPGYGTLSGQQGKYYVGLARGQFIHPTEWKRASVGQYIDLHGARGGGGDGRSRRSSLNLSSIASDARRSPGLKRVVVWEKYWDGDPPEQAPLLPMLGAGWERAGAARDYDVRFHWTWADLYVYRRTEYVKKETGPTPPRGGAASTR
jgi:hypothetical protein